MFFYANKAISVAEADFWEKSYLLRSLQGRRLDAEQSALTSDSRRVRTSSEKKETSERESISLSSSLNGKEWIGGSNQLCPLFIKDIAKSIVSAGKSLQLIRHVHTDFSSVPNRSNDDGINVKASSNDFNVFSGTHCGQGIAGLTLAEIFCVSLAGLVGYGDHIFKYFWLDECKSEIIPSLESNLGRKIVGNENHGLLPMLTCSEKMWCKFLVDTLLQKGVIDPKDVHKLASSFTNMKGEHMVTCVGNQVTTQKSFCPENPVISLCGTLLDNKSDSSKSLNLSKKFSLPPLEDESLRKAVLGGDVNESSEVKGTNYVFGFQFGESEYRRSQYDLKLLEVLFPFPTLLPSIEVQIRE